MADSAWNRWKLTAVTLMILLITVLATGLVMGNRAPSETGGPTAGSAANDQIAGQQAPAPTQAAVNVATAQPVRAVPTRRVVAQCNRYASAHAGPHDPGWEIAKDALIGGAATAGIGAAGGAIAGGGRGAGKGAAIGGAVGVAGGALYGINENRKHDEAYRAAYARCLHSHGYRG